MSFAEVVSAAVSDFAEHGFDSDQRLQGWAAAIRQAADLELVPQHVVEQELRRALTKIYERLIDDGQILRHHPGAGRYTIERVRPKLRDELTRRIMASADLIKLNREAAIRDTVQRFSGWATSVPVGGTTPKVAKRARAETRKEMAKLAYQVRRVSIDQGHKFAAALNQIVATDGGAIAAMWHQHYTRYPRESHKRLDGRVFLIRDNWAHRAGLVKPGLAGYTDEVEQPGELVFCRCSYEFIYALRRLPPDMITARGRAELERIAEERAA